IPDPRGIPQVGPNNWGSAFLPAVFQGTAFNADKPIPHLARPSMINGKTDADTRDFLKLLNEEHLKKHPGDSELAARIASHDQPCAALLRDLKRTGLLKDTLVVWVTEFGRMPTFQKGASGRDHNPSGFTVWFAGVGVKAGTSYGATDEFGHKAVEKVATIYDL